MQRIISTDEAKTILGISGTSKDAILNMWNDSNTQILAKYFGISEFGSHQVTDERVKVKQSDRLILSQLPVDVSQAITIKNTNFQVQNSYSSYTFYMDSGDRRFVRVRDSNGNQKSFLSGVLIVSYTAGWELQDKITVLDISSLAGKTITIEVLGVSTTYTFIANGGSPTSTEIELGIDEDSTASNIGTKLSGQVTSSVVTLPLETTAALGTATISMLTIAERTIPEPLRMCIALMMGGGLTEGTQKKGGVVSYSIGSKTVTFRNDAEASIVLKTIKEWAGFYKKFNLYT